MLLFKKLLRDIGKSLSTYIICMFVVAAGFTGYSVMSVTQDNLLYARDAFYEAAGFADGFATVVYAPRDTAVRRLLSLPGVAAAEGRIVKTARVPSYEGEDVQLRLVSLSGAPLIGVQLSTGGLPQPGEYRLALGDQFAAARGLKEGDSLRLSAAGRQTRLTVSGSGQSPEFIYLMGDNAADFIVDPALFGVAHLPLDVMEALFGWQGFANDFVITMEPGADFKDIEEQVRKVLEPYGVVGVYAREDQASNSILSSELDQLGKMAQVMPFLFLFVSGIILYITLRRLIEKQRGQIGTLKAFGYPTGRVLFHYVSYGGGIGLAGGLAGGVLGSLLAGPMTDYYKSYFFIPGLAGQFSVRYLLLGMVMSTVFCSLAAWLAARRMMKLAPAATMRPAAPKSAKKTLVERLPGVFDLFTVTGKMGVRNIFRSRARSLMTLSGVACAYMIMATLLSTFSLIDVFIYDYFEQMQTQDIKVSFSRPVTPADALRAARSDFIEAADPIAEVPVTLRRGDAEQDCTVIAMGQDATLYRLYDEQGRDITLDDTGIVLASHLATLLGVKEGDSIELETVYPSKQISLVRVCGVIPQYIGANAYMSLEALGKVSDYHNAALYIKAPEETVDDLLTRLESVETVAGVEHRSSIIGKYRALLSSVTGIYASMAVMAVLIGFSVIYTSSLIGFEELKREISVLSVLGLRSRETLDVISVEQWLLSLGGIILGIPLAYLADRLTISSMGSDLFSIPQMTNLSSLLQAALLTFVAVWLSNLAMHRKVKRIVPADFLRDRE